MRKSFLLFLLASFMFVVAISYAVPQLQKYFKTLLVSTTASAAPKLTHPLTQPQLTILKVNIPNDGGKS